MGRGDVDGTDSKVVDALQQEAQARLAANIFRLRAEKGWGQEEASWRAQVGIRAFQRLETARKVNPTLVTLARLAAAFGVDIPDLLAPSPLPPRRGPGRPRKRSVAPEQVAMTADPPKE